MMTSPKQSDSIKNTDLIKILVSTHMNKLKFQVCIHTDFDECFDYA